MLALYKGISYKRSVEARSIRLSGKRQIFKRSAVLNIYSLIIFL